MNENAADAFQVLEQEKVITIIGRQCESQSIDDYIVNLKSSFRPIDEHIILDLKIDDSAASRTIETTAKEIVDVFKASSQSFSQFSFLDDFSSVFPEKKLYIILKNPFFLSDQNEDITMILKMRNLIEKIRFCKSVFLIVIVEKSDFDKGNSYYFELKGKYMDQTYQIHIL